MKYYLGIDIGGTNIAFGIANENKKIIAKNSIKTNSTRHYDVIIEDMATNIIKFLESNKISLDDLVCIGIGVPGVIDKKTKIIKIASNLGWKNVDVSCDLKKYIDKDIYLTNDAEAATYGELIQAEGIKNMVMLTLGTGVGGGVIIDGEIFCGGDGVGFELGHLIHEPNGADCPCGNKGCVEMYVSASALVRFAKEKIDTSSQIFDMCNGDLTKIDGKIIFESAKNSDKHAIKTIETYIEHLAVVSFNAIMMYRPEVLMLGGGICEQKELLIDPLCKKVYKLLEPMGDIKNTKIVKASLGNDAGILGACFLKFNEEKSAQF